MMKAFGTTADGKRLLVLDFKEAWSFVIGDSINLAVDQEAKTITVSVSPDAAHTLAPIAQAIQKHFLLALQEERRLVSK